MTQQNQIANEQQITGHARGGGHAFSIWAISLLLALAGLVSGCGKKEAVSDPDAGLMPEAVAVREAFAGSPPSYRYPVEEALKLIRAGAANPVAYSEAMPQLQRLAANTTISPEQKQSLQALIQKLQSMGIKPASSYEIR